MAVVPPLAVEQLEDGVYLNLPEEIYFSQDRLGSSDLMKLYQRRHGWWWQSRHNPDRDRSQSDAQNYGSALHALLLEGLGAYTDRFAVEPDWRTYGDRLITSQDQLRKVLADVGWSPPPGISKWLPQEWWDQIELHAPDWTVKAQAVEEFRRRIATKRAADGTVLETKPTVSAVEDRMLRIMHDAATNPDRDDNVEVRELLGVGTGFPTLAEVSVLFTCPWTGLKRRARFDKPVPRHTIDLKSLANWKGRDLHLDIDQHIKRNNYDVQVGDQHVARIMAYRMLRQSGERLLHGGATEDRAWVLAMAERALPWDWGWLFYQKPDPSGIAPIIFPVRDGWQGTYHQSGHRKMFGALHIYLDCVRRFGLDKPWSKVEVVHYTDEAMATEHDGPQIWQSHVGWEENPVDGEELVFDHRDVPDRPGA